MVNEVIKVVSAERGSVQCHVLAMPDLPQQLVKLIGCLPDVPGCHDVVAAGVDLLLSGIYMLALLQAKHCLTVDRWKEMTASQRRKASDACFKLTSYACSTSTDGKLTVTSSPGTGKKYAPAQTQTC